MRNKITAGLAVLSILLLSGQAFANNVIAVPPPTDSGLFFGQSHSYSVFFRGNGEAIVYGRIYLTNTDEKSLEEFSLTIPGVNPTELVMFQQKFHPVCVQYDYQKPYDSITRQYPCLQYQDQPYPNYQYDYYPSGSLAEVKRITYEKSGNLYRFKFPLPIEPGKSGAIIFSYAAFGYVGKNLGLFKFGFETAKVPSRIQQMRVAVDVDTDLRLKGKKSSVNYAVPAQRTLNAPLSAGVSADALSQLSREIGVYGQLVKESKNLAPNESLNVKGEYASSAWRLYLGSIVWTLLILAGLFFGLVRLKKYLQRRRAENKSTPLRAASTQEVSILNVTNAGAGLISAMSVVVLTFLLRYLQDFFVYSYRQEFELLFFVVILLLYVLAIFGPAIYLGAKYGARAGLSVLIAEFLWFVVILVLLLILFKSGIVPEIYPKMYIGYSESYR